MADTDQSTDTKDTSAAEDAAGAEETTAAEASAPEAGETPAADAEQSAAEDAADPPEPAAEDAAGAGQPEPSPEAEQPAPAEAAAEEAAPEAAPEAAAAEAEPASAAPQHTYEELKGKTVAQMREIAEGLGDHDALHGYTTMHKEELLVALCAAMGIEAHEHHEVVGIDKSAVKGKIRELKKQRDALIEAKDSKQLKLVRSRIRRLKRKIHKATV